MSLKNSMASNIGPLEVEHEHRPEPGHSVKSEIIKNSKTRGPVPQKILSIDNRYISSMVIEKGIKLSPRAMESKNSKSTAGVYPAHQRYLMFEQDLNQKELTDNVTSTPNKKWPRFPLSGLKRSTAMYDLKSAAAGQPQNPPDLQLTDLTSSENEVASSFISSIFRSEAPL